MFCCCCCHRLLQFVRSDVYTNSAFSGTAVYTTFCTHRDCHVCLVFLGPCHCSYVTCLASFGRCILDKPVILSRLGLMTTTTTMTSFCTYSRNQQWHNTSIDLGHCILLNTRMLVKKSKCRDLPIKEEIRIQLHLNMNQVDDFPLSRLWTCSRKGSRMFSPSKG